MVILEDYNRPYPLCPCCDIMVLWAFLNGQQNTIAQCAKGEERKRRRLMAEDMRASMARSFQAHRISLNSVTSLKYLVHIITSLDDAWTELVGNLQNLRKRWMRLSIILIIEGAKSRVLGMFFKVVVQTVLIFWSYMWVMTPHMGRSIGGFQHRVAIWITGR